MELIQMNLQNRNRLTDFENDPMGAGGKDRGERIVRAFGMDMHTLLWITKIDNQQGPTV